MALLLHLSTLSFFLTHSNYNIIGTYMMSQHFLLKTHCIPKSPKHLEWQNVLNTASNEWPIVVHKKC
uniref:Putative secreted protein n=1 Tax=Ixodes ricinus TaxID=34613 RepID=A0A147BS74_IXORI